MDEGEAEVLAYMSFPAQHRAKIHSTNPIERLNGEIKPRSDVVGIFPNEDAVIPTARWDDRFSAFSSWPDLIRPSRPTGRFVDRRIKSHRR